MSSITVQPFTLTLLQANFYNIHTYLIVAKGETTSQKPSQAPVCTSVRNRRRTAHTSTSISNGDECERAPPSGVAGRNVVLYCTSCSKALVMHILVSCLNSKCFTVTHARPTMH